MKRMIQVILMALMLLSLLGCYRKEASAVKTYGVTDLEFAKECGQDDMAVVAWHYEMSDGTWENR